MWFEGFSRLARRRFQRIQKRASWKRIRSLTFSRKTSFKGGLVWRKRIRLSNSSRPQDSARTRHLRLLDNKISHSIKTVNRKSHAMEWSNGNMKKLNTKTSYILSRNLPPNNTALSSTISSKTSSVATTHNINKTSDHGPRSHPLSKTITYKEVSTVTLTIVTLPTEVDSLRLWVRCD